MNPTKKSFLLDVLKITPKTKLVGKGDMQVQATTAFKQYREAEEAVLAQIKKLAAYADAEIAKLAAEREAEVKAAVDLLEKAEKGDAEKVKKKAEEALQMVQATKLKAEADLSLAKAKADFNPVAALAKQLLDKLKMESLKSAEEIQADKAYREGAAAELAKKRVTAAEFEQGTAKLQALTEGLKKAGLKRVIEGAKKDASAKKRAQSDFEPLRKEFQKNLNSIEAVDPASAEATGFRAILASAAQLAEKGKYAE